MDKIFDDILRSKGAAPQELIRQHVSRIANAVELSAAIQAHRLYSAKTDDAALRARAKLAPLIQLRVSRMLKGNF